MNNYQVIQMTYFFRYFIIKKGTILLNTDEIIQQDSKEKKRIN